MHRMYVLILRARNVYLPSHICGPFETNMKLSYSVFAAGAFFLRGAGCTINDMWDRNIDNAVERTRDRPITSGQISMFDALVFLGGQLGVGVLLQLQLNWLAVVLGISSMEIVVTYPLMKRFTYYPQFVLGLAFNWG